MQIKRKKIQLVTLICHVILQKVSYCTCKEIIWLDIKIVHARTLESSGHNHKVYCADFGSSKALISGGIDAQLIFWDFAKGTNKLELTMHERDPKKKEGCLWISGLSWEKQTNKNVAIGVVDGTVAVYDIKNYELNEIAQPIFKQKSHFGVVNSVNFMRKYSNLVISCGLDWTISKFIFSFSLNFRNS